MANAPAIDITTVMLAVQHPVDVSYSANWATALAAIDSGSPWYAHDVSGSITEYDDAIDMKIQLNDYGVATDADDHTYQVLVRLSKTLGSVLAYCLVTPAATRDMRWQEVPNYNPNADTLLDGTLPTKLHAAISFVMTAISDTTYSVSLSTMQAFQDPDAQYIMFVVAMGDEGSHGTFSCHTTAAYDATCEWAYSFTGSSYSVVRVGSIFKYYWMTNGSTLYIYNSDSDDMNNGHAQEHWRTTSTSNYGSSTHGLYFRANVPSGVSTSCYIITISTILARDA